MDIAAGLGTGSRREEAVGRGVGVAEASRVRGHSGVEGIGDVLIQGHLHLPQQIVNDLTAGGSAGIHQLQGSKGGVAAVVVDAQLHEPGQMGNGVGQQLGGRHIHADEGIPVFGAILVQSLVEVTVLLGDLHIPQHMGGLTQLPQTQTQGRCGTHGIAVGTAVGENEEVIPGFQPAGSFTPGQAAHRRIPPGS